MTSLTNKRILLADDQHIITRLLTHVAKSIGLTVEIVHDGQAALERLRAEHFDVVLADIKMEPMSGLHLVSAMRKSPSLADVPVILMSGANDPALIVGAKRVGANGYLVKPFTAVALREQIERVLPML